MITQLHFEKYCLQVTLSNKLLYLDFFISYLSQGETLVLWPTILYSSTHVFGSAGLKVVVFITDI